MTLPPVIWKGSPNFGFPRGTLGRSGQPVRCTVRHRIVGTLASADTVFADPNRQASTHFGIGFINGRLEIHQYVNLSDAAWGNGDVREPTAQVVKDNPGINPNLYSISIEHEDGGSANRGKVAAEVWQASMDLGVVLQSGYEAIKAAGIRCRSEATATQLKALPATVDGHIDHHQIAGPNKPYCFRRWLDDPGFVEGNPSRRDRLLAALSADRPDVDPCSDLRRRLRRVRSERDALEAQVVTVEAELDEALADAAKVPRLRKRIALIKSLVAEMAADVTEA